jgi:hypothetical protein
MPIVVPMAQLVGGMAAPMRDARRVTRGVYGHIVVAALLGLTLSAACSACGLGTSTCFPEPLHVNPLGVAAGSSVIISSAGFKCNGSYPSGKKYQLTLGLVGRSEPMDLGSYPVNANGSFNATVRIPASASPGESYVVVRGSPFDRCEESGQGSYAGYSVRLTIMPATG